MYLAIDQYGNKTIIPNIKYSTLKEKFGVSENPNIQKTWVDIKGGGRKHAGYLVGQGKNNISLWLDIFKLTPIDEV